jgi:tRNA-dihydrouridine synthase 3
LVQFIKLHGRSREQRYTRSANIDYVKKCAKLTDIPIIGNGDIFSYQDYEYFIGHTSSSAAPSSNFITHVLEGNSGGGDGYDGAGGVSSVMIARGAIIKPWIFKEIKERKHYDISGSERFDLLKEFTNYGLEHWGLILLLDFTYLFFLSFYVFSYSTLYTSSLLSSSSSSLDYIVIVGSDTQGVETTRYFLLNWMSFLVRYVPVGIIEVLPDKINNVLFFISRIIFIDMFVLF